GTRMSRAEFERLASPETALFVGSPEQIVEKILKQHELFGHTRFLAQIDIGGLPYHMVEKNIELLATEVVPMLKKAIKQKEKEAKTPEFVYFFEFKEVRGPLNIPYLS